MFLVVKLIDVMLLVFMMFFGLIFKKNLVCLFIILRDCFLMSVVCRVG